MTSSAKSVRHCLHKYPLLLSLFSPSLHFYHRHKFDQTLKQTIYIYFQTQSETNTPKYPQWKPSGTPTSPPPCCIGPPANTCSQEHRQPGLGVYPRCHLRCLQAGQRGCAHSYLLYFHFYLITSLSEIAKGHTDASVTTRMTAAKDAVGDKIDESKHNVCHPHPSTSQTTNKTCY